MKRTCIIILLLSLAGPVVAERRLNRSLHQAVWRGDADEVKRLIQEGANVNSRDAYNRIPLKVALTFGKDPEVAHLLLDAGANVNIVDSNGRTALMWAIKFNNSPKLIQRIIDAGADVNRKDISRDTPLSLAAYENTHIEVARMLLEKGARVDTRNVYGAVPVIYGATNKNYAITLLLLKHYIDKVTPGRVRTEDLSVALVRSVASKHPLKVLKAFIKAGADVKMEHVVQVAVNHCKDVETFVYLLEQGADVNRRIEIDTQTGDYFHYPIHEIVVNDRTCQGSKKLKVINVLLKHGADVNARDHAGQTPLMWAAQDDRFLYLMKFLIGKGAVINAVDRKGNTALTIAEKNKCQGIIEYLTNR
jgi:ankyrin repeat protein